MDREIRQLERRAASGDYDAEMRLKGILTRFKLDEMEGAKEELLNSPGSMPSWVRYIKACHDLDKDPMLGRPYYRMLRDDIVALTLNPLNAKSFSSERDTEGHLKRVKVTGHIRSRNPYVTIHYPGHPSDKAKYGFVISVIDGQPGRFFRLYSRIKRDGEIDMWITNTVTVFPESTPIEPVENTFESAKDMLAFFLETIKRFEEI
jgi:hypothetical protein